MEIPGIRARRLLAIAYPDKLRRLLQKMLDEAEFLSPYGIRSVSKYHQSHPDVLTVNNNHYYVNYEPAESKTALFGGNSNWRGSIWFPINYLIIESLQKFHYYLGDDFKVECPTNSGQMMTLEEVATDLSKRLRLIFLQDQLSRRSFNGDIQKFQTDPY